MKKKLVSVFLVVALIAIAAAGTLAYFTDSEQVTNTMTVGNVQINIDEYQKKADGTYEPFKDNDFTLYPVENGHGVTFRNKVVYTTNTSPSGDDAYIRTIVLFEKNDLLDDTFVGEGNGCCVPGLHFGHFNNGEDGVETSVITNKPIHSSKGEHVDGVFTIGGEEYYAVVIEEAKEEAIAKDEALYSLSYVSMDKNITSKQIEGWGDDGVDIIVFSQGIQTESLTYSEAMAALGEINQTNLAKWLEGAEAAREATING